MCKVYKEQTGAKGGERARARERERKRERERERKREREKERKGETCSLLQTMNEALRSAIYGLFTEKRSSLLRKSKLRLYLALCIFIRVVDAAHGTPFPHGLLLGIIFIGNWCLLTRSSRRLILLVMPYLGISSFALDTGVLVVRVSS